MKITIAHMGEYRPRLDLAHAFPPSPSVQVSLILRPFHPSFRLRRRGVCFSLIPASVLACAYSSGVHWCSPAISGSQLRVCVATAPGISCLVCASITLRKSVRERATSPAASSYLVPLGTVYVAALTRGLFSHQPSTRYEASAGSVPFLMAARLTGAGAVKAVREAASAASSSRLSAARTLRRPPARRL